jgi:hypothetical protein
MITTQELLFKIGKFNIPVLHFEFLPRHRAWVAIHAKGSQSQVSQETVDYFETTFGTKSYRYANY